MPPWPAQRARDDAGAQPPGRRKARRWSSGSRARSRSRGDVVAQIVERTDGVPLFVEELTKTVLEGGSCTKRGDRYVLTGPLPPLRDPDHAAGLADGAARPARPPVKEVAQIGAVIGREFSYELLAAVAPRRRRSWRTRWRSWCDRGLVFARGHAAGGHLHLQARAGPGRRLRHALLQEQAPAAPRAHRRVLGGAVARYGRDTTGAPGPSLRAGGLGRAGDCLPGRPASGPSRARQWPRRQPT